MNQWYDEGAYTAGKQIVIGSDDDFEADATRLARAYVELNSLGGTQNTVPVLLSFLKGACDAQRREWTDKQNACHG